MTLLSDLNNVLFVYFPTITLITAIDKNRWSWSQGSWRVKK